MAKRFVYILNSHSDPTRYYTGIAGNVRRRLEEHNAGGCRHTHRWRPWRVPHELLHVDVPCAGCRARACPVPGHPCLEGVGVAEALAAVQRLAPVREAVA